MANKSLMRMTGFCGVVAAALAASPAAAQPCRLCAAPAAAAKPPPEAITISIDAGVDFSRVGLITAGQGGTVVIDPRTGARTVSGALIPLTGMPFQGTVTVRGGKNEQVEVSLPSQVTLSTTSGGTITLTGITTTLKANPKLDKDGVLTFGFGGQLMVDGLSDGDFRGTIPITVDYR